MALAIGFTTPLVALLVRVSTKAGAVLFAVRRSLKMLGDREMIPAGIAMYDALIVAHGSKTLELAKKRLTEYIEKERQDIEKGDLSVNNSWLLKFARTEGDELAQSDVLASILG
jgi:hypothetical protein